MAAPGDWRMTVKTEMRQAMIQEVMNTLSRNTTKDGNEIRDIAGKLELKSLQDAQNLTEYQNNVRTRALQIAQPPPPNPISYAATITQPPPSMPVPIAGALPGTVMTSSIPTPVIAASHSTLQPGTKPEEEEYWAKLKEMQSYSKSLVSMVSHVDTVIARGSGQQVSKIQEVRKNMLATLNILRDQPGLPPTHQYPRSLSLLQTVEKRIQTWMQSVVRAPAGATTSAPAVARPMAPVASATVAAAAAPAQPTTAAAGRAPLMASTGIEAKPIAKGATMPAAAPAAISTPLIGTGATPAPTLSAFVEATVAPEPAADQARKRRVLEFHMADHAKKMRDETEHFTRSENFLKFTRTTNKSALGLASLQYSISSGAAEESQPSTLYLTPSPGLSLAPDPRVPWLPQVSPRVEGPLAFAHLQTLSPRPGSSPTLDFLEKFKSKEALQQEIAQLSSSSNFAELKLEQPKGSSFVITIKIASRVYIPALTVTLPLESIGEGLSFHFGPEFEACDFFQELRKNFEEHLHHAPPGPYSLALLAETFANAAADVQCS